MHKVHGVLIAEPRIQPTWRAPGPAPRLRLLIELEPRWRVFFRNLADLLLSRRLPPVFISARPAPFWNDVFVGSSTSWASFAKSMLAHSLLLIVLVWSQSRVWAPVKLFRQQDAAASRRSIPYTPPAQSFRTAESRALRVPARSRLRPRSTPHSPAQQQAVAVRAEQKPGIVAPPDLKQATAKLPDFPSAGLVTPMVPFSATSGWRSNALSETPGAVGPAPQLNQATSRRLALPQASAVAPAPELGPPLGRAVKTASLRVVEPPPSFLSGGDSVGGSRWRSLPGTVANVVAPPPLVQGRGNAGNGRLGSIAGAGTQVVPPPPLVQSSGSLGTRLIGGTGNSGVSGGLVSMSGGSSAVVPPPPSVDGAGDSATHGRSGSLSGNGAQIIPPPPSVGGVDSSGTGIRAGPWSGGGSEVVRPAPLIEGAGNSSARGRFGSLPGGGPQIVPPPPTMDGGGSSGAGERASSLLGEHSAIVPTPPSVAGAGSDSGASGVVKVLDPAPVISSSASSMLASVPAVDKDKEVTPTIEELPLGLLGLVFAPPGTSYFSNFEVFVAKRRVGRDQLQLIKLVYEFLPYQRRLSEYDLNNVPLRVIKLRVTLDPSCNESLGRVIAPSTDSALPTRNYPELPPELRDSDRNAILPCYRTNADDFRKAMGRAR